MVGKLLTAVLVMLSSYIPGPPSWNSTNVFVITYLELVRHHVFAVVKKKGQDQYIPHGSPAPSPPKTKTKSQNQRSEPKTKQKAKPTAKPKPTGWGLKSCGAAKAPPPSHYSPDLNPSKSPSPETDTGRSKLRGVFRGGQPLEEPPPPPAHPRVVGRIGSIPLLALLSVLDWYTAPAACGRCSRRRTTLACALVMIPFRS